MPPLPTKASVTLAGARLLVDFDQMLKPGALDPANWTWRFSNTRFTPATASASAARVRCDAPAPVADPGADECDFSPPPFDVRSLDDVPAAAFAGYPITP